MSSIFLRFSKHRVSTWRRDSVRLMSLTQTPTPHQCRSFWQTVIWGRNVTSRTKGKFHCLTDLPAHRPHKMCRGRQIIQGDTKFWCCRNLDNGIPLHLHAKYNEYRSGAAEFKILLVGLKIDLRYLHRIRIICPLSDIFLMAVIHIHGRCIWIRLRS